MPRYTTRPEIEIISPKAQYSTEANKAQFTTRPTNVAGKMAKRVVLTYLLLPALIFGAVVSFVLLLIIYSALT